MRTSPHEQSEMCSQVLFAETMTILKEDGAWAKIQLDTDGYEGWVDRKMISTLSEEAWTELQKAPKGAVAFPVALAMSVENQTTILLSGGTHLPHYANGSFELLGVRFNIDTSTVLPANTTFDSTKITQVARFFLNTPYLWGGRNALGIDCSGFVQMIYSIFGIQLPRDASQQVNHGRVVDFLTEVKAGDLAFFENADRRIVHVGLMLDSENIMHASGRVKINKIDAQGILSEIDGTHSHQLRVIKRIHE